MKNRVITVVASVLATVIYLGSPAGRDRGAVEAKAQAVQWLKDHPGGALTGQAEVTYSIDGVRIATIAFRESDTANPDCPVNQLCLYAAPDFGYPRAVIDVCGYIDLDRVGWARRTKSIHNNFLAGTFGAGTVTFYRSDGGEPTISNRHKVLTLRPTRTGINDPDIDFVYHFC